MPTLIVTNGDAAAELLRAAGADGIILPWRDALHEGPLVAGPLAACSAVRAPWLAARFGLDAGEVATGFAERDATIEDADVFGTIEFWFEHDLYDQLQIVQALAALGPREGLVLVQADDFLGLQTPDTILSFADRARALDSTAVAEARAVWDALVAPDPSGVPAHTGRSTWFPFLGPALRRFLEELPAPGSGLGRTEQRLLTLLSEAPRTGADLFRATIASEEAAYLGDWSFFKLIVDLGRCARPLIDLGDLNDIDATNEPPAIARRELALTRDGEAVLAGTADHVALNDLDRWWAGTRLVGPDVWRYDRADKRLIQPASLPETDP